MVELSTDCARVFVLFLDITIKCWYVGSVNTKNDTYLIIPVNKNYQTVTKQIDLQQSYLFVLFILIEDKNKHLMKVSCGDSQKEGADTSSKQETHKQTSYQENLLKKIKAANFDHLLITDGAV